VDDVLRLIGAAVAFTVGGISMKYSAGLTRPVPSLLVFALFCLGAALQALAMRHADMGPTYIFVLGLESVLAFLLGVFVRGEPVTPLRIVAVLLVTAGIVLLRH
jgi:multidrug transporter EmrE-like cation transporter